MSNKEEEVWVICGRVVYKLGLRGESEKAMSTHSSTLVWKIPWTEEPGRL